MPSTQIPLRILLVEDEDNDAVLIRQVLNRGGLTCHAKRVDTQGDFLRELSGNPPDLILSDHGLPSFNGFDALELARERCPDTPFIFVTAAADEAQARTARRCGARGWVLKSDLPDLVSVVREAVRFAGERRQRRLAEQFTREQAEQLRHFAGETKAPAIFLLDHDGRVTQWDAGAAALFGFPAGEIAGRHFDCLYRAEDRAIGKPRLDLKAATGGRHAEEGWRVRADGTAFWARTSLAARRNEAGGFIGLAQDLTADRRTEEAGWESEELHRLLFEQSPVALLVVRQGRIVGSNGAARRLLGAGTPAALTGSILAELARGAESAALGDWLRDCEAGDGHPVPAMTEKVLRRVDDGGAAFTRITAVRLALRNEPGLLLLVHDASGEALDAEAQHDSEGRHAAILAASPDAIIIVDPDARVVEWNEAAEGIFGHPGANVRGQPVGELLGATGLTGSDLAELEQRFQAGPRCRERRPVQIAVRRANGEEFIADMFVNGSPAAAPRAYALILRERAATPGPKGEDNQGGPTRGAGSPFPGPGELPGILPGEHHGLNGNGKNGALPSPLLERAQHATRAAAEARRSIGAIISRSRAPWGDVGPLGRSEVEELERVIRLLEIRLDERELALGAAEDKVVEQNRALVAAEALLKAREELLAATQAQTAPGAKPAASCFTAQEIEALRKLKHELERQAAALTEEREALKARAEFIERSEITLMEKIQSQQEREVELDQHEENLKAGRRRASLLDVAIAQPA